MTQEEAAKAEVNPFDITKVLDISLYMCCPEGVLDIPTCVVLIYLLVWLYLREYLIYLSVWSYLRRYLIYLLMWSYLCGHT